MQLCSFCKSQNTINSKYCRSCGHNLQLAAPLKCPGCGSARDSEALYCSKCGQKLEAILPTASPESLPLESDQPETNSLLIIEAERLQKRLNEPKSVSSRRTRATAVSRLHAVIQQDRMEESLWTPPETLDVSGSLNASHLHGTDSILVDQSESTPISRGDKSEALSNTESPSPSLSSEQPSEIFRIPSTGNRRDSTFQLGTTLINSKPNELVTVQELLRMVKASGVSLSYTTLREWQKEGLISSITHQSSTSKHQVPKSFPLSTVYRLYFISQSLEQHKLELETIRLALAFLDNQYSNNPPPDAYQRLFQELTHSFL